MDIFLDGCVLELLDEAGIDVNSLDSSGVRFCYTPDLKREYRSKLENSSSAGAKALAQHILEHGLETSFFGFSERNADDPGPVLGFGQGTWVSRGQSECISKIKMSDRGLGKIPKNRTDAYLVAFAESALVITNDQGAHWKLAPAGPGRVVYWNELQNALSSAGDLASALKLLKEIPKS
jgi:hypothetical protein